MTGVNIYKIKMFLTVA